MISTSKNFYRPDEVAKMFCVSVKTVYRWVDTGRLDAEKVAGKTIRIANDAINRVKKPALE